MDEVSSELLEAMDKRMIILGCYLAVRCMGALLSLGHIERKKIVQCKFEKLLVQFHRKFFYSTEKEVAVQLIEGINEVK